MSRQNICVICAIICEILKQCPFAIHYLLKSTACFIAKKWVNPLKNVDLKIFRKFKILAFSL
ncbi:MAG: hypothetical protein D6814_16835 [Calditrichaeota bacterium]|nr:MAG: hypothetical protein D6814_16835 [Calditrichota bacterium]